MRKQRHENRVAGHTAKIPNIRAPIMTKPRLSAAGRKWARVSHSETTILSGCGFDGVQDEVGV